MFSELKGKIVQLFKEPDVIGVFGTDTEVALLQQQRDETLKKFTHLTWDKKVAFFSNTELSVEFRNFWFCMALSTGNVKALRPYLKSLTDEGWYFHGEDHGNAIVLPSGLCIPVGQQSRHRHSIEHYLGQQYGTEKYPEKVFLQLGGAIIYYRERIIVNGAITHAEKKTIQMAINYLLACDAYNTARQPFEGIKHITLNMPKYDYVLEAKKMRSLPFSLSLAKKCDKL